MDILDQIPDYATSDHTHELRAAAGGEPEYDVEVMRELCGVDELRVLPILMNDEHHRSPIGLIGMEEDDRSP